MGNDSSKMAERKAQLRRERMATGSLESIDSGVSFKSDRSKDSPIDFKDRVFPRPDDLIGPDIDPVGDHDDLMATGSLESNDSGVSLKSDRSKAGWIDFKDRVSPRPDFSSSEEEDVSDDEDLVQSRDAQREDDILPYMYPWSDDCDWMELADNLQGFFGSDVSAVDDWINSLDDLMAHSSVEAFGSGLTLMNDSFIRPRQHSLPRMVLKSMEACGSSLSLMNDSFIRTGQRSPPREEMNQELSSEVGWKHN